MAQGFVSGARTTFADQSDHILDLHDGMDFLNPRQDGIAILKKIGLNGLVAKSFKIEWNQVALATRRETVTLADGSGTVLTVANARQYSIGTLIRVENEVVRVTAIASATTLTITRGYAGTTGAAHAAKVAFSIGVAAPENSTGVAAVSDTADRLYNYVQIFERAVELSKTEIMQMSTEGNPLKGQLERRYIEFMREVAMALLYGVRYEDTTLNLHTVGGLKQFVTTNVTNVGGALTIAAIDAIILAIVEAGGDPKMLALSPYQKQKLDALDVNKQMLGKKEHTGGNLVTNTWQSGVLDHELDIVVDHGILRDELWILDTDQIKAGPQKGNGESGSVAVVDATLPGQDGKKNVIRGHLTFKFEQEKAHGYLYGLT